MTGYSKNVCVKASILSTPIEVFKFFQKSLSASKIGHKNDNKNSRGSRNSQIISEDSEISAF
ncbi:hypothetical protein BCY86_06480 [Pajaroellobacter abortibovis]|uniref:Uncharacterized protein n=1 Tax=Pajaroellobacter abortibovis TaxID=1882918 RepID=A0A1L6MXP9_9BACT|nr:hypothetical protein BCY86_06480 [Pajaroellobacter abortibovis]